MRDGAYYCSYTTIIHVYNVPIKYTIVSRNGPGYVQFILHYVQFIIVLRREQLISRPRTYCYCNACELVFKYSWSKRAVAYTVLECDNVLSRFVFVSFFSRTVPKSYDQCSKHRLLDAYLSRQKRNAEISMIYLRSIKIMDQSHWNYLDIMRIQQ